MQPEMKHIDTSYTVNVVNAGAVESIPINGILQSDASNGRVGNRAHIHKVMIRGFVTPTSGVDSNDLVRVIIFQDKQASGNTATVAQILQTASTNSFRNRDTTKRFNILFDQRFAWQSGSLDVAGTGFVTPQTLVENFKNVDFVTQWTADAATFAAISTNSIGLLTISKEADDSDLSCIVRVSYSDV